MDSSEESGLINGLRKMDETAWRAFYEEYSPPLREFLRLCLGNSMDGADEVLQMTLLRCVRSIGTFDPVRGRLWQWLKAVARNEAHTFMRSAPTEQSLPTTPGAADRVLEKVDREMLPEELLAQKDVQFLVQDCLLELGQRQRDVLVLKYIEGLKVAQIAQRLGQSPEAIESLLARAKESFRRAVSRRGGALEMIK